MQEKTLAPNHLNKPIGDHPQPDLQVLQIFSRVNDPRKESCNFEHSLTTILFIAVVCSLCGADDWETIVLQANAMIDWLARFVDVSNGIPCSRTFKRVFCALCPQEIESMLVAVMDLMREKQGGEVVSFDGKDCLCGRWP